MEIPTRLGAIGVCGERGAWLIYRYGQWTTVVKVAVFGDKFGVGGDGAVSDWANAISGKMINKS